MEYVNHYVDKLSEHFDEIPKVKLLSERAGCKTGHIALAAIGLTFLFVLLNIGPVFFTNLLGIVYPGYMSFKAVESHDRKDDKQWLTYWVVFGAFTTVDTITESVLFWLPFYQPTKLLVLLFLAWPETHGAELVYNKFLYPFLKTHEKKIDENLSLATEKIHEAKSEALHRAVDAALKQQPSS